MLKKWILISLLLGNDCYASIVTEYSSLLRNAAKAEDRLFVGDIIDHPQYKMFGVFDGHASSAYSAQYLQNNLPGTNGRNPL